MATAPGYYSYGPSIALAARGSQDVIDDTVVNGPRTVHACIGGHWQAVR